METGLIECGEVVGVGVGSVDVRVTATEACANCSHCSKVDKDGMLISDVRNDVGAEQGDRVEVEIPPGTDIRAGMYAYILPVAALLVGYGAGNTLGIMVGWDPDLTGAALGVLGVAGGMLFMRTRARKVLSSDRFRPAVRAIMSRARDSRV
ncbi:MAG: SoxR reducing system RseC family protein [Coriobacteriia bacterium]|nr:SoxR reducing system RseC family protein [Coriobacteriia bacterium]